MPTTEERLMDIAAMAAEPLLPELERYVVDMPFLGQMIKHPLVNSLFMVPGWINRQYAQKKQMVEQALKDQNWGSYLWLHERPWRLTVLEQMWNEQVTGVEELRDLLMQVWMDTEMPHQFGAMPRKLWQRAYASGGVLSDEPEKLAQMPEELVVYRGATRQPTRNCISWTLDLAKAKWFANRLTSVQQKRHRRVWVMHIPKSRVLGYVTNRGEEEIVVVPGPVVTGMGLE
jgi:hypothetical protein